jgi:LDH2 family malate/lactate/ureidoglycolate dehydrogenase
MPAHAKVYFPKDEEFLYREIEENAKKEGISISEYIRKTLLECLAYKGERKTKDMAEKENR